MDAVGACWRPLGACRDAVGAGRSSPAGAPRRFPDLFRGAAGSVSFQSHEEDDRKVRRREKNRVAAQRSRKKQTQKADKLHEVPGGLGVPAGLGMHGARSRLCPVGMGGTRSCPHLVAPGRQRAAPRGSWRPSAKLLASGAGVKASRSAAMKQGCPGEEVVEEGTAAGWQRWLHST